MGHKTVVMSLLMIFISASYAQVLINHNCTNLDLIPAEWIEKAKVELHIAYGHTSHGSQIINGMNGLITFKSDFYDFNYKGTDGALDVRDNPFTGASDLGYPDRTAWEQATRNYIDDNSDINVIIWSWCGQVSSSSVEDINNYLNLMNGLESDYPDVHFVYMTGHLDGTGLDGNLNVRNEQIRDYCNSNHKILYDFADIETYDPDGTYFGDKIPNDNCEYDSNGDGTRDSNWAIEWQNAHIGEWYDCYAAHSQPLNANLKAYAAWWLWARLAGWTGDMTGIETKVKRPTTYLLGQNHPNPFNPATTIEFSLQTSGTVKIDVLNILGQKIETILNVERSAGQHKIKFKAHNLSSGTYFYRMTVGDFQQVRKMFLEK